jgi:DNA modification methylase
MGHLHQVVGAYLFQMPEIPAHSQLALPFLETLSRLGGEAKPAEVIAALAEHLHLPAEVAGALAPRSWKGRVINEALWPKRVRWVRQDMIRRGHVSGEQRKTWKLTPRGDKFLRTAVPGVILTVYETPSGMALWARAEDAVHLFKDDSVNLIFTSPPYPLVKQKHYGDPAAHYLNWLIGLAKQWQRILAANGSLILNLADVYEPKMPVLSLYQEKLLTALVENLGYFLAGRGVWENPSKIPGGRWATQQRVRLNHSFEHIYWLSKTPHPKADNRRVLRPYSEAHVAKAMRGRMAVKMRPSGHGGSTQPFRLGEGSIPHSLLVASNSQSNDAYCRGCRNQGLPIHPARFPLELPRFYVGLTTEPGDMVYDPMSGSNSVGKVCEEMGRNWVSSENVLEYALGGAVRFGLA